MSLVEHFLPFAFAVFVWWFSTGAILWLDQLPRKSFAWSLAGATALAGVGVWGLTATADRTDVPAAYGAFLAALAVWAWHELTFLMGLVTGPVRSVCPEGVGMWRRFQGAAGALLYHEIALAGTALGVLWLTWEAPNQVGTSTFLVLFVMRLSAKLNVFIGAPHLAQEFLPEHLSYLKSYFGRTRFNPLMPFSVAAASLVAWRLGAAAAHDSANPFEAVGLTIVLSLLALAILEHLFLALPMQETALWRWALRAKKPPVVHVEGAGAPQRRTDPSGLQRSLAPGTHWAREWER